MKRRVVITGMGALTPVGHNVAETWNNLVNGVSGVDTITSFDTSALSAKIAAQIKDFHPEEHFDLKEARKMDSFTHFAMVAAREAVKDAGIDSARQDGRRVGVITGVGIGGIYTFEEETIKNHLQGPRRISPFFIPKMISNIAAAHIAIEHGFKGPNFSIASACASANHAIGTAFRAIQYGDADIIISGGAEAGVTALSVGGFCALRALSTRNDDPKGASRPFDAGRDGFVMSEGAAFLVLEELEHAKARGATIYAELAGYAATDDAFHITAPLDDKGETYSLKSCFGDHAYKLKINSTKSMVGHMLGAAAGIEAIVCVKTIETGILHPTINLSQPDPDCDLDYVPNTAQNHEVIYALSNSLGFGGHNSALVIKKYI